MLSVSNGYTHHLILNETTDTITVAADSNCVTLCSTCTPIATTGILSTSPAPNQAYCINNDVLITGNVNFSKIKVVSYRDF